MNALQEGWLKLKEWWMPLAAREKKAILYGGILLALFLFYQVIWSPLLNHIDSLRSGIKTNQKTLVFMQAADKEIQKNQGKKNTKNQIASPVILLSLLQKQVNHLGIDQSLTQLKQAGNNSVEIQFQKVEFDKFMKWLITVLKEQNVVVSQMSVVADATPGIANIDVILKLS